jgi:superfamily II DNA or RNA helicase
MRQQVQANATKSILDNKFRGIYDIAPRVGKSKILIDALILSKTDSSKFVIAAPYTEILNSWKKEFAKWNYEFKGRLITFRSLNTISLSNKLIVIDECQELSLGNYSKLYVHRNNIMCLSGSISEWTYKTLLYKLKLKPTFKYSLEQAINNNIVADYQIITIPLKLDDKALQYTILNKLVTEQSAYDYYNGKYNKAVEEEDYKWKEIWARKRMRIIYNSHVKYRYASKLIIDQTKRFLLFGKLSDTLDVYFNHTHHSKVVSKNNLAKFVNEEIDNLAVIDMVSMGVTIPNLKDAICIQLDSNPERGLQKVLRTLNMDDTRRTGSIIVLYFENTQDEVWLKNALSLFNQDKIIYNDKISK